MNTVRTATTALLLLVGMSAFAQRYLRYDELQFQVGTMNYNGEISTSLSPGTLLREIGPYASVGYTYYFTPKFGMGVESGYGRLRADDANHDNPERGLSFTSDLVQANAHLIYHFRRFGKSYAAHKSTIYLKLSGGGAWVHTEYPDDIQFPDGVVLYPGTNGGFNLGFGAGVKWRISNNSTFNVEFMGHYLYSDLMEGWKYRDGGDASDGYGGIRLGYSLMFF